jgi:hypothetical protein
VSVQTKRIEKRNAAASIDNERLSVGLKLLCDAETVEGITGLVLRRVEGDGRFAGWIYTF